MRLKLFIFLLLIVLSGCQKTEKQEQLTPKKEAQKEETVWKGFPKQGKSIREFIKGSDYEITEAVYGDLNSDKSKDAVVMLRTKNDETANRILLVFIKKGTFYELVGQNETMMGAEFTNDGHTVNDSETIEIENQILSIKIFCYGPCGNSFMDFSWKDGKMMLTHFETYDIGAGGEIITKYDAIAKTSTVISINTMLEEMPEEKETNPLDYKYSLEFSEFAKDSLNTAIFRNTKL